jgi:hypothetical protein
MGLAVGLEKIVRHENGEFGHVTPGLIDNGLEMLGSKSFPKGLCNDVCKYFYFLPAEKCILPYIARYLILTGNMRPGFT